MNIDEFNISDVGCRLKEVRKSINRTLKQMGNISDLSSSAIHEMEAGSMKPNIKYLFLLYKLYGVNINWLITGQGKSFMQGFDIDLDFGKDTEKIHEMLYLMQNDDVTRLEVLLNYLNYKEKKQERIEKILTKTGKE